MLRVVGGKFRGRKLEQPPKTITRPTMDRVKEAIFNVIQFKINNAIVLDLFAGSGSLSIEAISRGALKAIAVDNSTVAVNTLRKNIQTLDINNIEIMMTNVIDAIRNKRGAKFNFIFMDPPFANYAIYETVLKEIKINDLLTKTGLIILETQNPSKINIPEGFVIQRQKKYGISYLIMLSNNI